MNMKLKVIAAACLAMCASSAFAVTAVVPNVVCDTTTGLNMVNTCAPEVKMFVAGSSALGNAMATVIPADLFDTSVLPVITVKDTTPSGLQNGGTTGWYGMSKAGLTTTSKRLYVVYNNTNGSAAGVSILLGKVATIAEAKVVTVGPKSAKVVNDCVAGANATTVSCPNSDVVTVGDLAISDVHPSELYKLYAGSAKTSTLTTTPLALQGFGLGVSFDLYKALQVRNVAEGLIPATCVAGDLTAACQPTVRSADYTSLITKVGSIKTAAAFLGDAADLNPLTLARRDDLSGTQASSNIFFANNSCGGIGYGTVLGKTVPQFNYDATGTTAATQNDKLSAAVMGGGLNIINSTNVYAGLTIMAAATGGNVTTALNAAAVAPATVNYAIGVIGLGSVPAATTGTWKFVKIDGVSPNYKADGTASYKQREQFANGNYPFAMTAYAAYPTKIVAKSVAALYPALLQTVITGLKDSTLHDLPGIAYYDGAAVGVAGVSEQALVHRTAGNNCSPLLK
jgi:hypothetical protein